MQEWVKGGFKWSAACAWTLVGVWGCGDAPEVPSQAEAYESQTEALVAGTVVSLEAENLVRTASAIGSKVTSEAAAGGGKYVEFNGTASSGAWIEFTVPNIEAGAYDLRLTYKSNTNRGIVQASVDGVNQGSTCNQYATTAAHQVSCNLGSKTLTAGSHKIRFTVTGKSASSSGHQMTVDRVSLIAKATKPCDIYGAASTPCVAAYSMVRPLSSSYTGPLYQVRAGSSATNTGTGGTLKDIGVANDGFADTAAQDAFCSGTICTVAVLYDQSGNGNHLRVAKKGLSSEGQFAALDDFEASATRGAITAGGRKVYSLYMNPREGYRTPVGVRGTNVPLGTAAQGIYQLADGTHVGTACCADFGNVSPDPTKYAATNALFFGRAFWGMGAGAGPWMMADFERGIWAGGSVVGDPGWGAFNDSHPPNLNNPSLRVPFALGFLKTSATQYSLRMADAQAATALTTAYVGAPPHPFNNPGGIVLGVGGANANNSFSTFYEGAIVAGYPTNGTELAVLNSIKTVGYSK